MRSRVTTTGWRPTCEHYPRVEEWPEYIKGPGLTDEEKQRNLVIKAVRLLLLNWWEQNCDVEPCRVLDIFAGTCTVGQVCIQHGRRFVGIELNPEYIELAYERTNGVQMTLV